MTRNVGPSARDYVLSLELPHGSPALETLGAPAVEFSDAPQAIVIGDQLAEFTKQVSAALRTAIADSMLIAQLAANRAAAQTDVLTWYNKYVEVLQNLGWQVHDFQFESQQVSNPNLSVHEAIIPVLAAMLGPQAAIASLVMTVLKGLQGMSTNRPWITLFDQSSQHAEGAKFQVAHVDANASGQPEIALICFTMSASRTITQVLFFKFSEASAELKKAESKLVIDLGRLESAKDALANRVAPFINDFIKKIDI